MAELGDAGNWGPCGRPNLNETITAYCFAEIGERERDEFEEHLLECDFCWHEVQRLDAVVGALRSEKTLTQRQFLSDIVGMAGISAQFQHFLGGHRLHAWLSASIYAAIIALSVFMETAFQYDRFAALAWTAAPVVFVWLVLGTIGALAVDWVVTRSGRDLGLAGSVGVVVSAAALQYVILRPFLPSYPITEAAFQTWTAQAAYLKGTVYAVVFVSLFMLTPFHFVIRMQRELQGGRYRLAFEVLTGGRFAITPMGAPYLRVWLLGLLLLLGGVFSIVSTAHLLEALKVSEHTNLFMHTIQVRWLLFLALGLETLAWYQSLLNELRRECTVVYRLAAPGR
jgi:hypothetical protein